MARPLPMPSLVLLGVATILLWMGFLLGLGALVFELLTSGALPDLFPSNDETFRTAITVQYVATGIGYLGVLVLGTVVLISHVTAAWKTASGAALLLVRFLMFLSVLQLFAANAVPFVVGGVVAALPGLAVSLPLTLVSIAMLLCADAYLRRGQDDTFA